MWSPPDGVAYARDSTPWLGVIAGVTFASIALTVSPLTALAQSDAPKQAAGLVAVALADVDSVALLDAHSLERVATLPVGNEPHEIAATADGRTIYVADAGDSSITVIDAAKSPFVRATWRLPGAIGVHDLSVDDDGSLWAASGEPALILGLDTATGAVRSRHTLARPGSWMLDARGPGGALTIANLEGGAVTLLDPESGQATILEAGEGEIDAAASPDLSEVWSVNARTGTMTIFDASTGRVIERKRSGAGAGRIVFTPNGRTALVVHSGDSTVVAYDVESRAPRATVTISAGPKVIALSRDGRRAYITHPRGALTMLDVPSMRVLRVIELGGRPDGVAVAEPL